MRIFDGNNRRFGLLVLATGAVVCLLTLGTFELFAQTTPTASESTSDATQEFAVAQTFDDDPFQVQMKLSATKQGYRIFRLTYPSPIVSAFEPNNTVPADYYLPDGVGPDSPPRPAVICLHILNGNFELVRMLCSSLASRGVPAVMFKLPYYGERALPGGLDELEQNGRLFVEALPQGSLDARRTFDVLAARPEIDSKRISISGISLGSMVSATTAGKDPRFWKCGLILSGGDLLNNIRHSRETRTLSQYLQSLPANERTEIEQTITAVDPLTHAAGLRDRALAGKVLMINASIDKVIPPAATQKLANALGIADRVFWLEGLGHYTSVSRLPEIMNRTVNFFAEDLPAEAKVSVATDPTSVLAAIISQAASMFTIPPTEGHCHLVDISADITDRKGKKHTGELNFAHGTDYHFRLQLTVPVLGKALLGQSENPWMATDKTVFLGTKNDNLESRDPLAYIDSEYVAKLKMIAGGMATLKLAPAILEQFVDVESKLHQDGSLTLHISPKKKKEQGEIQIVLQPDGRTPQSIVLNIDGFQGTLNIRSWQPNSITHDSLFQPPVDLKVKKVESADLYRIYAALLNFGMELLE